MPAMTIKCPSCGGNLAWEPGRGSLQCPYCGSVSTEEELLRLSAKVELQAEQKSARQAFRGYHCQNCGAEIVTGETTAATRCYFCHSPVVLSERVSEEFQPDGVIPFSRDRGEAEKAFRKWLGKKHFVNRAFFTDEQMESFSGVYYPYFIGEIEGDAVFDGQGTRVSTRTSGRYITTTTRYFSVHREGTLRFTNLVRKALGEQDRQLSDGIQPYDMERLKGFASGYLSGFLAHRRDLGEQEAREDMIREARGYAPGMIGKKDSFSTLKGSTAFSPKRTSLRYVLLPVWVLTYKGGPKGAPYYYLMNDQTGAVCGKLPIAWGRLIGLCAGVFAAVAGLLCAGGAFVW